MLMYILPVTLLCLVHFFVGVGGNSSSQVDKDFMLNDEGSGSGVNSGIPRDLEISGAGNGVDDEDYYPKPTGPGTPSDGGINDGKSNNTEISDLFDYWILISIICGVVAVLLFAICLIIFIIAYSTRRMGTREINVVSVSAQAQEVQVTSVL